MVVVRNQINLYFAPGTQTSDEAAITLRGNFHHLLSHFPLDSQEDAIRGADPEHIKRHHGYEGEVNIVHQHIGFDRDVTPKMLTNFFEGLLKAQKDHHGEKAYQFVDEDAVKNILKKFSIYYNEFVGSPLQKQFLEERELSKEEKESLVRHARQVDGTLSQSDKKELEACGIDVKNIKPTVPTPSASQLPQLNISSFGQLLFLLPMGGHRAANGMATISIVSNDETADETNEANDICPIM
ncbi:hypothetical protein [Legionella maioricensis]|uniref:Uncharacterized protein n=1 Tax=Legionella maioricensis TaxID=2896528 RepID=A0A9X2D530_9GAMM|nr:hypothetical protein [Legionella maioricensis]MCL9685647.1 hypothetical protein [Legionella maioricensis]MCL9689056.1 hypothetical protein [Legionella maioricensis]